MNGALDKNLVSLLKLVKLITGYISKLSCTVASCAMLIIAF